VAPSGLPPGRLFDPGKGGIALDMRIAQIRYGRVFAATAFLFSASLLATNEIHLSTPR
jgi:hypothetical protein